MVNISAVVFSSEDTVSFLNSVLPFHTEGVPVVVVGAGQGRLTSAFGFKSYEGGRTFGRRLLAGLRKVTTEFVTFVYPGVVVPDMKFFVEAVEILGMPDVGLVVPSLPKGTGPQSVKRSDAGSLVRVAPWCFVARTQEVLGLVEKVINVLQDERLVQLLSLEYLKQGRFCYVLPTFSIETDFELQDKKVTALDISTKPLTPLLLYQFRKDPAIPKNAEKLFEEVIPYKTFEVPEVDVGKLVFLLKEGEDFSDVFTQSQIERMCFNPDPFVLGYQFPVLRVCNDKWCLKDQTTWEIRAFASIKNITSRILVNPYYAQQIPYEALRPVNAPIIRELPETSMTSGSIGPIQTPSLTIATIMRNEMKNLPTYLSAAGPYAQEVILVDTGSADGSSDFAEKFGCKVIKTELNDDFSKARNLYLNEASCTWLLQQDLDEIVDYKQISAVLFEATSEMDAIQFSVHNLTPKENVVIYQDAIRLVRDPHSWYYYNRIHETFERCAAEESKRVSRVPQVVIYHLGFLSPRMQEKLEYYRKLTTKQMEEDPDNPLPYFNLALDLLNVVESEPENLDVAIKLLNKAVTLHPTFALAQYELSRVYCQKALAAISKVLEIIQPDHPMVSSIRKVYKPLIEYTQRYIVK